MAPRLEICRTFCVAVRMEGNILYMDETRTPADYDPTRAAVARALRARRAFCGMTQAQLIAATGISKSALERLEGGKRDLDFPQLVALSSALGQTPTEFVADISRAFDEITQRPSCSGD